MSVRVSVSEQLKGLAIPAWKRDLILALAGAMDDSPNASSAKELRSLMDEVVGAEPAKTGDVADDLAAKRASRRTASA